MKKRLLVLAALVAVGLRLRNQVREQSRILDPEEAWAKRQMKTYGPIEWRDWDTPEFVIYNGEKFPIDEPKKDLDGARHEISRVRWALEDALSALDSIA